jgi:hypothetical protein
MTARENAVERREVGIDAPTADAGFGEEELI